MYQKKSIKIHSILQSKAGILGIPKDIFGYLVLIGILDFAVVCGVFRGDGFTFAISFAVVASSWLVLTYRGVWRFLGAFIKPPVYIRRNIKYQSFLSRLEDAEKRTKKKSTLKSRR
jgi:hypothetical protein